MDHPRRRKTIAIRIVLAIVETLVGISRIVKVKDRICLIRSQLAEKE